MPVTDTHDLKGGRAMAQPDYLGLCRSCMHCTDCVFIKGMSHSVVFCEEFQIALPAPGPAILNVSNLSEGGLNNPGDPHPEAPALHQGLCCDCENRHACGLRSTPEGGIWYCEEYR
jgi:hypothetical protein